MMMLASLSIIYLFIIYIHNALNETFDEPLTLHSFFNVLLIIFLNASMIKLRY